MRRPILLFIIAVMVLALAACGTGSDTTSTTEEVSDASAPTVQPTVATEEAEAVAEEVEVAEEAEEDTPVESAPAEGGVVARAITTEPSGLDPHGPPGSLPPADDGWWHHRWYRIRAGRGTVVAERGRHR